MKINSLSLRRTGLHEAVEFVPVGSMVGLIGPNGSGKSTVLAMLEYVITGSVDDASVIDDYVQNGTGNASAEADITLNDGKNLHIFRQFGSTPKRLITYDGGPPIRAAKEAEALITKLLGADKKAVSNAVFVKQGTLHNVLFGDPTERLNSFVRLLDLSFCQKRVGVIEARIAQVKVSVSNVGPLLESAEVQVAQKRTHFHSLSVDLQQLPDVSALSANVSAIIDYNQKKSSLESDHGVRHTSLELAKNELTRFCEQHHTTRDELSSKLEELNGLIPGKSARITCFEDVYRRLTQRKIGQTNLDTASLELEQALASLKDYPNSEAIQNNIKHLRTLVDLVGKIETAKQNLEKAKATYARTSSELMKLMCVQEDYKANLARISKQLEEAELLKLSLRLQGEMIAERAHVAGCAEVIGSGLARCGKCGLSVNPSEFTQDQLVQLRQRHETETAQLTALLAELRTAKTEHEAWLQRCNQASDVAVKAEEDERNCTTALAVLENQTTGQDLSDVSNILQQWEKALTYVQKQEAAIVALRSTISQTELQLGQIKLEPSEMEEPVYSDEVLQSLRTELKDLETKRSSLNRLNTDCARLTTAVDERQKECQRIETNLQALVAPVELPELTARLQSVTGGLAEVYGYCEQIKSQKLGIASQSTLLQADIDKLVQSIEQMKQELEKDKVKLELIEDLHYLKNLMSAQGLPAAVVAHRFARLVQLTQTHLAEIGADFQVFQDPEDPFSMNFVRNYEPENLMHMRRLSGGQKVRLCLAFLLALQEYIVSNVGLLVLDEPSAFLDEEGVDSFITLLEELSQTWKNSNCQMWVCDHRTALLRAFTATLQLDSKR